MIAESRSKVKTILETLIIDEKNALKRPDAKFLIEGTLGVMLSGTTNLTQTAESLKESISVKQTQKRLQRMVQKAEHLDTANRITLRNSAKMVTEDTVLALDGGDLVHLYGEKFQDITEVRDGSTGKIKNGYWWNQVTGYDPETRETFPVITEMYSTIRDGFESAPKETHELVRRVVAAIGAKGLWAMDRGYDSKGHFREWHKLGITFITRACNTRDVWIRGKHHNIMNTARSVNRRHNYHKRGRFGYVKVMIPVGRKAESEFLPFTLIVYKGKHNKESIVFITNGHIHSSREIRRRLTAYFKRWSVEEGFRFEKQGFGVEQSTVRSFHGIRSLLGLSALAWLVLVQIRRRERLREAVLMAARPMKQRKKDRPRFLYYQLLRGVQLMFEGVRRIFRFRITREERALQNFRASERPLWVPWLNEAEIMG